MLCYAMLCHAVLCHYVLSQAMPSYPMLGYALSCYSMLRPAVLAWQNSVGSPGPFMTDGAELNTALEHLDI